MILYVNLPVRELCSCAPGYNMKPRSCSVEERGRERAIIVSGGEREGNMKPSWTGYHRDKTKEGGLVVAQLVPDYHHVSYRWLLHDPNMRVRTTYLPYLGAVQRYFRKLIEVLEPLQAAYGGPIIAFQIENEFSHYAYAPGYGDADGSAYMKSLYKVCSVTAAIPMASMPMA